jgi:hypothetical protein
MRYPDESSERQLAELVETPPSRRKCGVAHRRLQGNHRPERLSEPVFKFVAVET